MKKLFVPGIICLLPLVFHAGCEKKESKTQPLPAAPARPTIPGQGKPVPYLRFPSGHAKIPSGPGGPPPGHSGPSTGQPPRFMAYFSKQGGGIASISTRDGKAQVVFNGKPGKPYDEIKPDTVLLSDDGRRIVYGARTGTRWMMVIDGAEKGPYDNVGSAAFSPDGSHVAYQARRGSKWHVVSGNKMNAGCKMYIDRPLFSGDSTRLYTIENTDVDVVQRLVVSDLAFKQQHVKEVRGKHFFTNENKTRIGVIEQVGDKERLVEMDLNTLAVVRQGEAYDSIRFPTFAPDGVTTAYAAAERQRNDVVFRYLILGDKRERLPDDAPMAFPVIRPDNKGAGIIMSNDTKYYLHQAFFNNGTNMKYYDAAGDLSCSKDGSRYAFVARTGKEVFVVVNEMAGPAFDYAALPVFSPDDKKVVYQAQKGDKQFMVVADEKGRVLRQHPAHERIYDPVFTPDGKSVAYGVKDGDKLVWTVEKL